MLSPRVTRALLALLFGWLPMVLVAYGTADTFDSMLLRGWFNIRGHREVPTSVSIVRIDKPAYDLVERSTGDMFPRTRLAELVDTINRSGPKLIMLDYIFEREWEDSQGDHLLAKSLSRSTSIIGRTTQQLVDIDATGARSIRRISVQPRPIFARAAKEVIPLGIPIDSGIASHISLAVERGFRSDAAVPLLSPLRKYVSASIVDPAAFDLINFYGGPSTVTSVSAATVLSQGASLDTAYFKARTVFIGMISDAGVGIEAGKDTFVTSFSNEPMAGIEVHATIAANLLDGTWIRRLPKEAEGIIMAIWTYAVAFFVLSSGPLRAFLIAIGSGIVWFGLSYYVFSEMYYFIPGIKSCCVAVPAAVVVRWLFLIMKYIRIRV